MNKDVALKFVGYSVDDALNGQAGLPREFSLEKSRLVGWQCGFEPMFVLVNSYLNVSIDDDEAVDLATDYLREIGWFSGEPSEPDYVL